MSWAIEVIGLQKSYRNHTVLKNIEFRVEKGEIFALLGVNGAGKTTALECIEGVRRYDAGSVRVYGRMGIQFQTSTLPAYIRPMEAVKLFAKWNGVKPDVGMLSSLGFNEFGKKQYEQLSTGQKRRLHLALAFVGDPDIIFLDEPTAGIDVEGRLALHSNIRELKRAGKTAILASHDMAEIEALCDRVAILSGGRIVFCGTVAELTRAVGRKYRVHVETDVGVWEVETENITDALLKMLGEVRQKNLEILDIKVDRGTLEQHFVEMVRRDM